MLKRRFYLNGIAFAGMVSLCQEGFGRSQERLGVQEPQQWMSNYVIGSQELPKRDEADNGRLYVNITGELVSGIGVS